MSKHVADLPRPENETKTLNILKRSAQSRVTEDLVQHQKAAELKEAIEDAVHEEAQRYVPGFSCLFLFVARSLRFTQVALRSRMPTRCS